MRNLVKIWPGFLGGLCSMANFSFLSHTHTHELVQCGFSLSFSLSPSLLLSLLPLSSLFELSIQLRLTCRWRIEGGIHSHTVLVTLDPALKGQLNSCLTPGGTVEPYLSKFLSPKIQPQKNFAWAFCQLSLSLSLSLLSLSAHISA